MTENEAKFLEKLDELANDSEVDMYSVANLKFFFEESANTIRKLIEEIQQYRAIGTIDEFKALKEKNEPRRLYGNEWNPVHVGDTVRGLCPVCMTEFVCITPRMYKANNYGYCMACGQKLDWQ